MDKTTFRIAVLTGQTAILGTLSALLKGGLVLIRNQEKLMADFTALRGALESQKTELVSAVDRVAADVQALQQKIADLELDTADQQEIDSLTAQVQESVETLRGIDPVKAVDDVEQPSEGGTGTGEDVTPAEPGTGEPTA